MLVAVRRLARSTLDQPSRRAPRPVAPGQVGTPARRGRPKPPAQPAAPGGRAPATGGGRRTPAPSMSGPHSGGAATSGPKDGSMAESSLPAWHAPARALVRRRGWVLGCWGALVAFGATRGARTADRLDLRGG